MPAKGPEVEIIKLLKSGGPEFLSGQDLSVSLGVSRTAVWKHIKTLRKAGYSIEASPSKGYRLAGPAPFNGTEISALLATEFVGRNISFYTEIDSTNIKAFELGRNAAPEGTAVIAETQTRGKGRIGRRWESPPGVNLYTSIILRPSILPQEAQGLTFVMAVAVAEAIALFSPVRPAVKWPNDILLGGLKAAGILMEMDSEPDRVHFVVAGIGVNVNIKKEMFPEFIRHTATSISAQAGAEIDRSEFCRSLFSSIEKWYKVYLKRGFAPVLEEWKGYFDSVGKTVKVTSFNKVMTGTCVGVDKDGALLFMNSGVLQRVISGDVEAIKE